MEKMKLMNLLKAGITLKKEDIEKIAMLAVPANFIPHTGTLEVEVTRLQRDSITFVIGNGYSSWVEELKPPKDYCFGPEQRFYVTITDDLQIYMSKSTYNDRFACTPADMAGIYRLLFAIQDNEE